MAFPRLYHIVKDKQCFVAEKRKVVRVWMKVPMVLEENIFVWEELLMDDLKTLITGFAP